MSGVERRIEELEEKVGLRDVIIPVIELAFVWANVKTESVCSFSALTGRDGRSVRRLQTSFEKKVDTEERDCE